MNGRSDLTLGGRVNRVLGRLVLAQEGGARDYARERVDLGRGGHGAHGDPSRRPSGNSRPEAAQWAERIERVVEAAEQWAEQYFTGKGAPLSPDTQRSAPKSSAKLSQLKQRMHEYEGHDPVYVAFFELASVEMVRRARRELGLNVTNGHRLESRERPLTAPARESLRVLQDVGGEG